MAALQPCLVVAVVALASGGGVSAYYGDQGGGAPLLQRLPVAPAADLETASYLLPRLAHKYRPAAGDWLDVPDPRLYLLTENDVDDAQGGGGARPKRTGLGGGPSLSIVNPLDVLRQRLLLEIARRRMRQSEQKIEANRQFLKTIGKRSADQPSQDHPDDDADADSYASKLLGGPSSQGSVVRWSTDS